MYVVAGASGQTGGAAASALLEQGKEITVLVRSAEKGKAWQARGTKIAVVRLEDTDALQGVLSEAEGAYLLIPPNYSIVETVEERKAFAEALGRAVAASGIPHVVFLSSIGAQHSSGTGPILNNHNGEIALGKTAKNLTVLRPPYFMENWAMVLPLAKEHGILPTFLTPGRKIPMMATRDIGRFAADSLVTPAQGRRVLELAGPEDYTPEKIARTVGSVLGREVTLQPGPVEAVVPTLVGQGFPESTAKLFAEMFAGINSGHVDYGRGGAEFRRGQTTPAQVFAELLKG